MIIQPYVLGSGRAAQAILKSLSLLEIVDGNFSLSKAKILNRDQSLKGLVKKNEFSLLIIANPHALHAPRIVEADKEGFSLIVSEKPVCTSLEEIKVLSKIKTPLAVCHGYRQSWGIQTLKKMIEASEFGEIFAIEGRYWQSSTAQRALEKNSAQSWKNDIKLSGPHDALLDIATHWADTANFLMPEKLEGISTWLNFANAESQHRDSHVHLLMSFQGDKRALCSVSKNVHGATNHFEVNVLGARLSATWNFLNPDILQVAAGPTQSILARKDTSRGSTQAPFHGVGWLEGYIEILRQAIKDVRGEEFIPYPNLKDALFLMEKLFTSKRL